MWKNGERVIDFFVVFFPLVKSKERQTNCLPLMISQAWNHGELQGLIVSWAQHLEVTNALKQLKNSQFENLNDIYIILMSMFAPCKWSSDGTNHCVRGNLWISILKERDIFRWRVVKFFENFAQKRKLGFRCCATPIIMTLMPMFATYGVKEEQMISFMKIANRYFERK